MTRVLVEHSAVVVF
uniref:Uncharacterized protein n=1 Tax=Anguilla anguilla TaxID=7936 RepID=A0A0E9UCL6_ANGAN